MSTIRFNMKVPGELHKAFKSACAAQGRSMTDVILDFMRAFVKSASEK